MTTSGNQGDQIAERVGRAARELGISIGVAESLTGGMVIQALAKVTGSNEWLQGGIVAYASDVKRMTLGVDAGAVVSEQAAVAMAAGARTVLRADVTVALTGVGGPDRQDGEPPGTVWLAVDDGARSAAALYRFDGDPNEVCVQACAAALAALDERLSDRRQQSERVGA